MLEIFPTSIDFKDVAPGSQYEATVTILNRGSSLTTARARLRSGPSKGFYLVGDGERKASLAPGLEMQVVIRFQCQEEQAARTVAGELLIDTETSAKTVRLAATPPIVQFSFPEELDFGTHICDGRVLTQTFRLGNDGALPGRFSLSCKRGLSLVFEPEFGVVPAHAGLDITAELVASDPGSFRDTIAVFGESATDSGEIRVVGHLMEGKVAVLEENRDQPVGTLAFKPTYYGTVRRLKVRLRNWRPEALDFVVVLQDNEASDWGRATGVAAALQTQRGGGNSTHLPHEHGDLDPTHPLMQVHPPHGQVAAFGEVSLTVIFSPVFTRSKEGWHQHCIAPSPRDVPFRIKVTPTATSLSSGPKGFGAEFSVIGHALPVLLHVEPRGSMAMSAQLQKQNAAETVDENRVFDFGTCCAGKKVVVPFQVFNHSAQLPLHIRLRRLAHFSCTPNSLVLPANGNSQVTVTFCPRQLGVFNMPLVLEVVDASGSAEKPVVYELYSHLRGTCVSDDRKKIKPFVGTLLATDWNSSVNTAEQFGSALETEPDAVLRSHYGPGSRMAHPNETKLARSVRPHPSEDRVKSRFTGGARYTYTDLQYSYSAEERAMRTAVKERYDNTIMPNRQKKLDETRRAQRARDPVADTRTKPVLPAKNVQANGGYRKPDQLPRITAQLKHTALTETCTAAEERLVSPESKPQSKKEQADCSRALLADERCLIVVETDRINFEDVNVLSSKTRVIKIANGTSRAVLFAVKASSEELSGCLPWQAVIPSKSSCLFTVIFKALALGSFHRDIPYSLNGVAEHRIVVSANVIDPDLLLSVDKLELAPVPGTAGASVTSCVTLINNGNAPVPFSWCLEKEADAQYWSIQPPVGEVVARSVVQCEVCVQPTATCPLSTKFLLGISSVSQKTVSCSFKLGKPECSFLERRVQFGVIPLHLQSLKTCTLVNKGHCPAYFQTSCLCSHSQSWMAVTPAEGCVPPDGQLQVQVLFRPEAAMRFEGSISVSFRGGLKLTLKVWATIEAPKVRLDREDWIFGSVYTASVASLPVTLTNDGTCRALITFDLSKRPELQLKVPALTSSDESLVGKTFYYNNRFTFELAAAESISCMVQLYFCEISSLHYAIPVEINELTEYPEPEPHDSAVRAANSRRNPPKRTTITHPHSNGYPQPFVHVTATTVSPPLSISKGAKLSFNVPENKFNLLPAFVEKALVLKNHANQVIHFSLNATDKDDWPVRKGCVYIGGAATDDDSSASSLATRSISDGSVPAGGEKALNVVFMPLTDHLKVDVYDCVLNFSISEEGRHMNPAVEHVLECIPVSARLDLPQVTFSCPVLRLTAAPLDTHTSSVFAVTCMGFRQDTRLDIELPAESSAMEFAVLQLDEESSNNSEGVPVGRVVEWLDIAPSKPSQFSLLISFVSKTPASISSKLTLTDVLTGEKYSCPVQVMADNSLLSVHAFLASNVDRYDIVFASDGSNDDGQASTAMPLGLQDDLTLEDPSRRDSLRTTGSSFTLRFHPGYGYAIDDATTITMVQSSIGNTVFTRSPSPYTDGHYSTSSFDTATDKTWTGDDSELRLISAASTQSEREMDVMVSSVATELSLVSDVGKVEEVMEDTPCDTDPQRLLQEVMKLRPRADVNADGAPSDQSLVIEALERWFEVYGWPDGRRRLCVPDDFRRGYRCPPAVPDPKIPIKKVASNAKKAVFTSARYPNLDDVVCHLAQQRVPGIPLDKALPSDVVERALQLKLHFSTITKFLSTKGCLLSTIDIEDLLDFEEYAALKAHQKQEEADKLIEHTGKPASLQAPANFRTKVTELVRLKYYYELASREAWTALLLQLVKVFSCDRITGKAVLAQGSPVQGLSKEMLPATASLASNVYSHGECNLLAWINYVFDSHRLLVKSSQEGDFNRRIEARWVTNFDSHFSDGLVFAVLLGAYAPFLLDGVLCSLYLKPVSDVQRWHNILSVITACQVLCMDDIPESSSMATPHSICMLMFCVTLFRQLPKFLGTSTRTKVDLNGALGKTTKADVRLKNSSNRAVVFKLQLVGKDASHYSIAAPSPLVSVGARSVTTFQVVYRCSFLAECECILLAVSQTLSVKQQVHAFTLQGSVTKIPVQTGVDCSIACYEQDIVKVQITNPFPRDGRFQVIVCEHSVSLPKTLTADTVEKTLQDATLSLSNLSRKGTVSTKASGETVVLPPIFWCPESEIFLASGEVKDLEVEVIPLQPVSRYCSIVLACPSLGDFVVEVYADVRMPLPVSGGSLESVASLIKPPRRAKPSPDIPVHPARANHTIYLRCGGQEERLTERLLLSSCNKSREKAVVLRQRWTLSAEERQRRAKLGMLLATGCVEQGYFTQVEDLQANQLSFSVTANSEDVIVPSVFSVPFWRNTALAFHKHKQHQPDISFGQAAPGQATLDFTFVSQRANGRYPFRIVLWHPDDVRVFQFEVGVSLPPILVGDCVEMATPTASSVVKKVPVVNSTVQDWPLAATVAGRGFSGPDRMIAKAMTTTHYLVTFHPLHLGQSEGLLTLLDTSSGNERCFKLLGNGTYPPPASVVTVPCRVGEEVSTLLHVPNDTDFGLYFKIVCGIPWLGFPDEMFVEANSKKSIQVPCRPTKHGLYPVDVAFYVPPGFDALSDEDKEMPLIRRKYGEFLDCIVTSSPEDGQLLHIVRLNIKSKWAPPQRALKFKTCIGNRSMLDIPVTTAKEPGEVYKAVFTGGRDLDGPREVTAVHGKVSQYPACFTPTRLTKMTTSRLILVPTNFVEFEHHYAIEVQAMAPETVQLPSMSASLGRSSTRIINLSNPVPEPLTLQPRLSNRRNFKLDLQSLGGKGSGPVVLEPGQSVDIPLVFVPSKADCSLECSVEFANSEIGSISYSVVGKSLPPAPLDPITIHAPVHGSTRHKLVFKTPLDVEAVASVQATMDDVPNMHQLQVASCLITHFSQESLFDEPDLQVLIDAPVAMQPGTALHVPLMFSPQCMARRRARVELTLDYRAGGRNKSVTWHCDADCIPMCTLPQPSPPHVLVAPVGVRTEQRFLARVPIDLENACLQPPGAVCTDGPQRGSVPASGMAVSVRSRSKRQEEHDRDSRMLARCAAAHLQSKATLGRDGGADLTVDVIFLPSFEGWFQVSLVLSHELLGEWHLPVSMHASRGDYDGVVHMELASLNQEMSVVLEIHNKNKSASSYQAFFAAGSHQGLSVRPAEGTLPPSSSTEGAILEISFSPKVYRLPLEGVLIVKTDDHQQTYKIEAAVIKPDVESQTSRYVSNYALPVPAVRKFVQENRSLRGTRVAGAGDSGHLR